MWRNNRLRQHFENLVCLTIIQVANGILPLVIYPYIYKVLGAQYYTMLVTTEIAATIMVTAICYSFDIEGTVAVAATHDQDDRASIFNKILFSRMFIFVAMLPILIAVTLCLSKIHAFLVWAWVIGAISYGFYSYYFFIGIQKNLIPAITTTVSRLVSIGLILLFVRAPEDYILVPIFLAVPQVVAACTTSFYAYLFLEIRFFRVGFREITKSLKLGLWLFMGNISVVLYRDCNVALLGMLHVSPASIAIYSLAEKLVKGIQSAVRPINQLFLPKIVRELDGDFRPTPLSFRKIFIKTIPQLLIVGSLVVTGGVVYVGGQHTALAHTELYRLDREFLVLIAVMAPAIIFGVLNFNVGSVGLTKMGKKNMLTVALITTGVINVAIFPMLVKLSHYGAPLSFVLSEFTLFAIIFWIYLRGARSVTVSR